MIRKLLILSVALLLPAAVLAQFASEKRALKSLNAQKWERAFEQLQKILHKDSLNPVAPYVLSCYYSKPANPYFQVDSAQRYALRAQRSYLQSPLRQRERFKRFPLDSIILTALRKRIDSAAFVRAQNINSEAAYDFFIRHFPHAREQQQAILLRETTAFTEASREDTRVAYSEYVTRYPFGQQTARARALFEQRLYEESTRDGRLASYRTFLKTCPQTPYREDALNEILALSTAGGTPQSFKDFIDDYPGGKTASRARALLYHLLSDEKNYDELPDVLQNDSVRLVLAAEQTYLVPFLHKDTFGFMNANGEEVLQSIAFDELDNRYRCGNIDEDVIALPGNVIGKNGVLLYQGHVTALEDLGSGFMLIQNETCTKIIHKSGFAPGDPCVEDASVLAGSLLAVKKDNRWAIRTFMGRELQPYQWDDITTAGDIVIFKRDNKYWLSSVQALAATADHSALPLKDAFDEIRVWPGKRVWARAGRYEGVFDQQLAVYIPFQEQQISSTFFGGTTKSFKRSMFYNEGGASAQAYDTLWVNEPWIGAKSRKTWSLIRPAAQTTVVATYDSVFFAGTFAIGVRRDSLRIHSGGKIIARIQKPAGIEFVAGQDSAAFIMISKGGKKSLYNHLGRMLFTVTYDHVQHAGGNIFIVTKKDRKGLVNAEGKIILPIEYDAIGTVQDGKVSLLRAKKFGLFDVNTRKLIKPAYQKNVLSYNKRVLIALKDSNYGLLGWDDKPLSAFEFSEVKVWSDSIALVKKNTQWMLYNFITKTPSMQAIQSIRFIRDKPGDRLAIIRQNNTYGVIHSHTGMVLPLNYSDLINVGSSEKPMYFTEKHVEEASLFVVIYYTDSGRMIRKEVYEQDEYDRIYCVQK